MNKPTRKEKLRYWFDNHMSKGSVGMIQFLIAATLVVVFLITFLIIVLHWDDEAGFFIILWDNLATVINAWVPYSDDGTIGYVALSAVCALMGVLFTSILIGIFSTAIEEKVDSLKKGNTRVLEEGHVLLLGFRTGEYELLSQLIQAAGDDPACIVVASNLDKTEMDEAIQNNLDIPKNIRIICRSIDICDPVQLACCSPETCRTVIVHPDKDDQVIRCILSVTSFTKEQNTPVIAEIHSKSFLLPNSFMKENHVILIRTGEIISRIISRSSAHPGLSGAYIHFFEFKGSEIYLEHYPETAGMTFYDLNSRINNGVAVGFYRDGVPYLNPDRMTVLKEDDQLIIFEENEHAATFGNFDYGELNQSEDAFILQRQMETLAIIGSNQNLSDVISELPRNINRIVLINNASEALTVASESLPEGREIELLARECRISKESSLFDAVQDVQHVILLSESDDEITPDFHVMFHILHLRALRQKFNLSFTITAEMQLESNRNLIADDKTDFIVSTNISAMFLAQLVESPEIEKAFREILSDSGNELYFKRPSRFECCGENSVVRLRRTVSKKGYVFLGYVKNCESSEREYFFNPQYDAIISLDDADRLILLGEE